MLEDGAHPYAEERKNATMVVFMIRAQPPNDSGVQPQAARAFSCDLGSA
jgi:hypothetical protein